MPAFMGVWMSSMVLTPLAVLLTYRAINDIGGMISFDGILDPIKKLLATFSKSEDDTKVETIITETKTIAEQTPITYPENEIKTYHKQIKINGILYVISIGFAITAFLFNNLLLKGLLVGAVLVFLYFVYNSQKNIEAIASKTRRVIEPGLLISLLVAFPFYILIYLYNKKELEAMEVLKNNNTTTNSFL
jgi:lipopolysaccharide export system permease protein